MKKKVSRQDFINEYRLVKEGKKTKMQARKDLGGIVRATWCSYEREYIGDANDLNVVRKDSILTLQGCASTLNNYVSKLKDLEHERKPVRCPHCRKTFSGGPTWNDKRRLFNDVLGRVSQLIESLSLAKLAVEPEVGGVVVNIYERKREEVR